MTTLRWAHNCFRLPVCAGTPQHISALSFSNFACPQVPGQTSQNHGTQRRNPRALSKSKTWSQRRLGESPLPGPAPSGEALLSKVLGYVEARGGWCSSRDLGRYLGKDTSSPPSLPPASSPQQLPSAEMAASSEAAKTALEALRRHHGGVNAFLRRHHALLSSSPLAAPPTPEDPRGVRLGVTVALTPTAARRLLAEAKAKGDPARALACLSLLRKALAQAPATSTNGGNSGSSSGGGTNGGGGGGFYAGPLPSDYAVAIGACKAGGQWKEAVDLVRMMDRDLGLTVMGGQRPAEATPSTATMATAATAAAAAAAATTTTTTTHGGGGSPSGGAAAATEASSPLPFDVPGRPFAVSAAIGVCGQAGRWREALGLLRSLDHRPPPSHKPSQQTSAPGTCVAGPAASSSGSDRSMLVGSGAAAGGAMSERGTKERDRKLHWAWERTVKQAQAFAAANRNRGKVDVACFGAALDACAKAGRASEALELLLDSMPRARVLPNARCCASAIHALGAAGRLGEALALLLALRPPNQASPNQPPTPLAGAGPSVGGGGGGGNSGGAHFGQPVTQPFGAAVSAVPRDLWCFASALVACERASGGGGGGSSHHGAGGSGLPRGAGREALALLDLLERDGLRPNVVVLNTALSACAKSGMYAEALDVLHRRFKEAGLKPDTISFNAAINACASSRDGGGDASNNGASKFPPRAVATRPSSGFGLLGGLEQRRDGGGEGGSSKWEAALALLDAMKLSDGEGHRSEGGESVKGPRADVVSYSTAMTACGRAGQVGRALLLLEEMVLLQELGFSDVTPNEVSFGAAVSSCAKAGKWRQCVELFRDMASCGVSPSRSCFASAIDALEKAGQESEADRFFGAGVELGRFREPNEVSPLLGPHDYTFDPRGPPARPSAGPTARPKAGEAAASGPGAAAEATARAGPGSGGGGTGSGARGSHMDGATVDGAGGSDGSDDSDGLWHLVDLHGCSGPMCRVVLRRALRSYLPLATPLAAGTSSAPDSAVAAGRGALLPAAGVSRQWGCRLPAAGLVVISGVGGHGECHGEAKSFAGFASSASGSGSMAQVAVVPEEARRYARQLTGHIAVEVEGNAGRFAVPRAALEAWISAQLSAPQL